MGQKLCFLAAEIFVTETVKVMDHFMKTLYGRPLCTGGKAASIKHLLALTLTGMKVPQSE